MQEKSCGNFLDLLDQEGPQVFISELIWRDFYQMILFNLLPYREALRLKQRQDFFASILLAALIGGLIAVPSNLFLNYFTTCSTIIQLHYMFIGVVC